MGVRPSRSSSPEWVYRRVLKAREGGNNWLLKRQMRCLLWKSQWPFGRDYFCSVDSHYNRRVSNPTLLIRLLQKFRALHKNALERSRRMYSLRQPLRARKKTWLLFLHPLLSLQMQQGLYYHQQGHKRFLRPQPLLLVQQAWNQTMLSSRCWKKLMPKWAL